jgi:hypothetical protein
MRKQMSGQEVETCHYLEIDGQEVEFTVTSNVSPGSPGSSPFCPIEKSYPPEPPEVEHVSIRGGDVVLAAEELVELASRAGEKLSMGILDETAMLAYSEAAEDAYWDEADRAYDAWKDKMMEE